jgi:hypothetical protein
MPGKPAALSHPIRPEFTMQRSQIDDRLVNDSTRISQIIVGAMVLGVVMFLAVVLLQFGARQPDHQAGASRVSYLAAALFVGGVCLSWFVPRQMVNAQVAKLAKSDRPEKPTSATKPAGVDQDSAKLLPLFQTKTIIANVLLEAPAFFATHAYMFERQWFTLAIAIAAVVLMLTTLPTRGRVKDWLQSQQDRIDGIRQFRGSTF